eukprot:gene1952-2388_t
MSREVLASKRQQQIRQHLQQYDLFYKGINVTSLSIVIGFVIRILLIIFSEWQDANMLVKYTDIDYVVYTDASRFVVDGLSPYDRSTYRYTPLLSYLLIPNILIHKAWGKLLFVICDIVISLLLKSIIIDRFPKISPKQLFICLAAWVFNPFAINVSTRGNAESVIGALVLATIYCLSKKKLVLASILADNRHNFSVYFYQIYLNTPIVETVNDLVLKSGGAAIGNMVVALASFLPQLLLLMVITIFYYNDLEFCLLLETITFVAFNKVCTVQYFIWYFSLLPLVIPSTSLSLVQSIVLFGVWMGSQSYWLFSAFKLEFLGQQTFMEIWFAGILFFLANIYILVKFILNHNPSKPQKDKI